MKMRRLGKTNLMVSEIGFGGEWLPRHSLEHSADVVRYARDKGVNIIDCWMADPVARDIIGAGIEGCRDEWIVQGHFGTTWQNGQYVRTREMKYVKPAFEDLLRRLKTDYIDLGMIHYMDSQEEWERIQHSDYLDYIMRLKSEGVIRHIGLSTHNPLIAQQAAKSGFIEMMLFSINPAYDLLPPGEEEDNMFAERYDEKFNAVDPSRVALYQICEENDVGLTVMKAYAGGRLFDANRSPFGVALTPVQCIHYALTRPAVSSVLCGCDEREHVDAAVAYETATDEEKDYAAVLAGAPMHACHGQCTYCGHCAPCLADLDIPMINKFYDLATVQPEVPASIQAHYEALEQHASECLGCRDCESRCPFGVSIADRMAKAAGLFGL